jgi:hypothetical protein
MGLIDSCERYIANDDAPGTATSKAALQIGEAYAGGID